MQNRLGRCFDESCLARNVKFPFAISSLLRTFAHTKFVKYTNNDGKSEITGQGHGYIWT